MVVRRTTGWMRISCARPHALWSSQVSGIVARGSGSSEEDIASAGFHFAAGRNNVSQY